MPPAQTGPPFPAEGAPGIALTVVEALDALLPDEGSFVAAETDAPLTAVPAAEGALTAMVIAGAAPTASVARVHVTVAVPLQLQPGPVAETRDAPVGSVSETATDAAVEGPPLATFSVYVMGLPAQISAGPPDCAIERSARAKTVDVVEAPLLAEAGSFVADETPAVLTMDPASAGVVTEIEIGEAAVTPSEGSVHVTGPVPEQVQPAPLADTNVVPAGSVSVTDTELACDGPAFETFSV